MTRALFYWLWADISQSFTALIEQFLTSSSSQNFPLFYFSLIWWKWSHLGGGFHKPDACLQLIAAKPLQWLSALSLIALGRMIKVKLN